MEAEKFGSFVQTRRKELGLKQADLAEQIHVTDKAISRWERGVGFPDIKLLEPLAKALDVSILELIQSERIEDHSISTGEAEQAISGTLDIACAQHHSIYKHPAYWLSNLGVYGVMAFFIVTLCYFVDAIWIRAIAVYLVILCGSLGLSGISTLLERSINPDSPMKSHGILHYLFLSISFLGGLLLILSFPVKELKGQDLCDIIRIAGFFMLFFGSAYRLYEKKN